MAFDLDYPTTRRFTFKYFTPVLLILATLWLVLITLVNVVAVAYETVPFTSLSYNSSIRLWYEKFVPTFWLPPSRQCDPSLIPVGGGNTRGCVKLTGEKAWLRRMPVSSTRYVAIMIPAVTARKMG